MRLKFNILILTALGVLVIANAFGDWPEEVDSNDYTGAWTQIYTDIMKAIAPLQGAITDTNISASADIDGSKLEDSTLSTSKLFYSVPYFAGKPGDSSVKFCYGDAKLVRQSDNDWNYLISDTTHAVKIVFDDSSDVGNPAFGGVPRVFANFVTLKDTVWSRGRTIDLSALDTWSDLKVRMIHGNAESCSVVVRNWGTDTLWLKHTTINWLAIEDKDGM